MLNWTLHVDDTVNIIENVVEIYVKWPVYRHSANRKLRVEELPPKAVCVGPFQEPKPPRIIVIGQLNEFSNNYSVSIGIDKYSVVIIIIMNEILSISRSLFDININISNLTDLAIEQDEFLNLLQSFDSNKKIGKQDDESLQISLKINLKISPWYQGLSDWGDESR